MIDAAINHIGSQLNQFLKRTFDLNENIVEISNILELDGNVASNVMNKLVVFLVNVEKDSVSFRQQQNRTAGSDRVPTSYPPVYLNLYVMVAGHFSGGNYPEALKFISNTISFFQRRPVFDHQNSPDLDKRIDKLILDIDNLSVQDLSHLWGILGGKYLPSILYKVRMVSFDSGDVRAQVHAIKEPRSSGHH
jgi:hypothetical protein